MIAIALLHISLLIGGQQTDADSLRLERIDGRSYIIHRVDSKETLYAIARRYKVPVAKIVEANPGSDTGIDAGKLLRIPYPPVSQAAVSQEPSRNTAGSTVHVVEPKETLYAVSRRFRVSVEDIIRWNNLSSNEIKAGQRLTVSGPASRTDQPASEPVRNDSQLLTEKPAPRDRPEPIRIDPAPDDEKKESGTALLMEGSQESRKYLALHATIPYGTVVRIRNRETRQEIFVRIVGTPIENVSGVVMRISKAAMDRLGGADRVPVDILYFR